jgi:ribonuclease D
MPLPLIDTDAGLASVLDELDGQPRYALDTEFHGERTYYPQLALVQVAWPGGTALLDPLAVDIAPLGAVLRRDATMVAHACDQDLTILERACGAVPARLFDTQVAAGFMGLGTPALAALAARLLRRNLAKGDRLTDWTKRPLSAPQCEYAASDVEHLLDISDALGKELDARGRLAWAEDECEARRVRARGRPEPETAWWRIKGSRQFRGATRGVAQSVTAWRERAAEAADIPPRFVLPDLALMGIIQKPPRSRDDLRAIRGIDGRHTRDSVAREILAAVERGVALTPDELHLPERDDSDRTIGPAVSVISAWLQQRAHELELEAQLLATRADLVELLNRDDGRLTRGWRAELVGQPIRALMEGRAALTLADGGRRIVLDGQVHGPG